jgi:hypothetical protein
MSLSDQPRSELMELREEPQISASLPRVFLKSKWFFLPSELLVLYIGGGGGGSGGGGGGGGGVDEGGGGSK